MLKSTHYLFEPIVWLKKTKFQTFNGSPKLRKMRDSEEIILPAIFCSKSEVCNFLIAARKKRHTEGHANSREGHSVVPITRKTWLIDIFMSIWTDLTPFTLKIKRIEIGVNRIKFQKEFHYLNSYLFLINQN